MLPPNLDYARAGDTIVVWKLDRLGRSTVQLIELIEELKKKGIHLKSLSESIDTTSATGTLFFQFMCMLAEHERNIIRERTMAGQEAEQEVDQTDCHNTISLLPLK